MGETALMLVAIAVFAYALMSRRLSSSIITGPLVFIALGWALSGVVMPTGVHATLHVLAEITLVVVLFSDAAHVDARALLRQNIWPTRMLLIGLPLAVLIGTGVGLALLPDWPFWEVAVLAAILAPTDAALGQAVIDQEDVPERVRRALAAESGLNDGMALPLILFLACVALGGEHDFVQQSWLVFAIKQIGIGAVVGVVVGLAGAFLVMRAIDAGLADDESGGLAVLALAGACYLFADALGGNGFVAAFIGGLAFGSRRGGHCTFAAEFLDGEGRLLVLASFLLIGLILLPEGIAHVGPAEVALVIASLVLVRPLAIWISLIGSDASPRTRIFLGWFGPRGLATALFALLVVDRIALEKAGAILEIAAIAVGLSAVLHGITAAPAARHFGPRLGVERSGAPLTTGEEG